LRNTNTTRQSWIADVAPSLLLPTGESSSIRRGVKSLLPHVELL